MYKNLQIENSKENIDALYIVEQDTLISIS